MLKRRISDTLRAEKQKTEKVKAQDWKNCK